MNTLLLILLLVQDDAASIARRNAAVKISNGSCGWDKRMEFAQVICAEGGAWDLRTGHYWHPEAVIPVSEINKILNDIESRLGRTEVSKEIRNKLLKAAK